MKRMLVTMQIEIPRERPCRYVDVEMHLLHDKMQDVLDSIVDGQIVVDGKSDLFNGSVINFQAIGDIAEFALYDINDALVMTGEITL